MKRKYLLLLCVLFDIIAISLAPINVLLVNMNMPEFVCILASFMVIASTTLYIAKAHTGKKGKASVCVFASLSLVISIFGSYCNPYWNSISLRSNVDYYSNSYNDRMSSAMALEDLDYAMKYLRKLHPALYRGIPENIREQYELVKASLQQTNEISVNELAREIETIFSILNDGHTYVRANDADRRIMKYYRKWVNEGYDITAVNGITIEELLEQKSPFYSFEVSSWEYEWLSDDIVTVAGLDYLEFDIEDGIEYTLTSADGRKRVETCYPEDFVPWDEYAEFNGIETETTEKSFVSYEIDQEKSLAILQLDECTYNSEYVSCIRAMFKEIKDKKIHNIAVDLRKNGGGSDRVITEFFRYLDIDSYKIVTMGWRLGFLYLKLGDGISENKRYEDLIFDGDLYLITSANTFSSAMMFAEYVKDNSLGTIVGEAPGNNPNCYGEVACFKLPNSKLLTQISTKLFYRADKESKDELVYPDIECKRELAMEELYNILNENR